MYIQIATQRLTVMSEYSTWDFCLLCAPLPLLLLLVFYNIVLFFTKRKEENFKIYYDVKMWLYTHTQLKYPAIEKNEILTFFGNIDGFGGYYAKWNKSDK